MNFITLSFAFFFLLVLGMSAFFRKGTLTYKVFLLGFSLFFYASAGVYFVPLLLFVGFMNWLSARLTFQIPIKKKRIRKSIIGINILIHVLLLAFYKYYEIFLLSMEASLNYIGIPIPFFNLLSTTELLLPIGLSFYTFQGLSYSIDQYRSPSQKPESLFHVLLFVSFFPTILAGPILRGHEFFAQLNGNGTRDTNDSVSYNANRLDLNSGNISYQEIVLRNKEIKEDVAIGFSFILSGLFKKVVLASYLSEHIVRDVFLTPSFYSSTTILIAVYAYAMQIYCDFSGYSDLATGISRLMGYKLPQNFNAPYLACSLQDFWRRWHITLSLWLRDYLYIPLGGNKKGNKSLNLIITMTLGGLWHGSHLRFLIWGLMHGIGLSLVYFWQRFRALFHPKKPSIQIVKEEKKPSNKLKRERVKKIMRLSKESSDTPFSNDEGDTHTKTQNEAHSDMDSVKQTKKAEQMPLGENKEYTLVLKVPSLPKAKGFRNVLISLKMFWGWFITFHFVSILWIFFRADDVQTAFDIIKRIFAFNLSGDGFPALVLVAIFLTMFLQKFGPLIFRFFVWFLQKLWAPIQVLLIAILCGIILKLGPDGVLPFIYFQF